MDEQNETVCGRASIRSAFKLSGRGIVLVLEDGFTGTIHRNGTVQGERGSSAFSDPEFCDGRDELGARKSWLAVIARAENSAELFQPGDVVAFHP